MAAIAAAKRRGLRCTCSRRAISGRCGSTLETDGVNAYSPARANPEFYRDPRRAQGQGRCRRRGRRPSDHLADLSGHGPLLEQVFLSPVFPHRRNPFALPVFAQIVGSVAPATPRTCSPRGRWLRRRCSSPKFAAAYFLALMQRAGDSQLCSTSNYTNETFAGETIESFSQHAPADARLVFKLNPLDPGMVDYERVVMRPGHRARGQRADHVPGRRQSERTGPARPAGQVTTIQFHRRAGDHRLRLSDQGAGPCGLRYPGADRSHAAEPVLERSPGARPRPVPPFPAT